MLYHSYALASWRAVRIMYPDADNFLFVDITGEVTDISLTERGVLSETVSFSLGRSSMIKSAAKELDVAPEIAVSYLAMESVGTADTKLSEKIQSALQDTKREWNQELIAALKELNAKNPIPKNVFVTVDSDVSKHFVDELNRPLPIEFNISQNMFKVTVLDAKAVNPLVRYESDTARDSFLGIESIFIHSII